MVTCRSCMASSKRRLHLRRGAVDFVGQDEVGEDRALARAELRLGRDVDHRADQVGRQQVGRELDAAELGGQRLGKRFDGRRFRQARHAFQKYVAVAEQSHQQPGNHLLLAHDRLAKLGQKPMHRLGLLDHAIFDLLDVNLHELSPISMNCTENLFSTRHFESGVLALMKTKYILINIEYCPNGSLPNARISFAVKLN